MGVTVVGAMAVEVVAGPETAAAAIAVAAVVIDRDGVSIAIRMEGGDKNNNTGIKGNQMWNFPATAGSNWFKLSPNCAKISM